MSETEEEVSSFFKIFLDNDRGADRMRIPSAFRKNMKGKKSGAVYFSGRGEDNTWQVKLAKDNSCGLYFGRGWKEFVNDHSICSGDFLIFKFDGEVNFKVTIYDPTGCEKHATLLASEEEEEEEEEEEVQVESEDDTSADPHFTKTMKEHNVLHPLYLDIPLAFARQYLDGFKKDKTAVICCEGINKDWPVNIVWSRNRCSINGGWRVFARDNQIKVGDTFKFVLLQEPFRFQATILSRNAS